MNRSEFHGMLLTLVKAARSGGLCQACVCQELTGALEAIIAINGITSADLKRHGIDTWPGSTLTDRLHTHH